MSTVKQMADEEANRVEAEEEEDTETPPTDATTEDGEPAVAPAPEGPTQEQYAALDREDKRHEQNLGRIMGADFSYFARCGSCDGLGFYMPPPPQTIELKPSPDTIECEVCAGYGQVLTGAKAEAQPTTTCSRCGGVGWRLTQEAVARSTRPNGPAPPPIVTTPGPPAELPAQVNEDPFVLEARRRGYLAIPTQAPGQ